MSKTVIGITGGVGSGKSTVLDALQRLCGARIIQADLVAREMMEPGGRCYTAVIDAFGPDIQNDDGTIDRGKLADIIFKDESKRERLNRLTHPLVKDQVQQRIRDAEESVVVYESALPKQAYMQELCQEIWFVHVPVEIRIERLMISRGYSREKCMSIMANQLSDEEFLSVAHRVIENGGTPQETEKQLQKCLRSASIEYIEV